MISKIVPTVVDIMAEYAICQKSAGEPNHIGTSDTAETIGIHWHIDKGMNLLVNIYTMLEDRRRYTVVAPILVTFINIDTKALKTKGIRLTGVIH